MERRGEFQATIGKTNYINGSKVEAYYAQNPFQQASDTAEHEAKHVVAGIDDGASVEMVSVIPGPGYLGITQFNRFTEVGAAAPHADGHSGTSWDVSLIEMRGGSVMSAGIRARNIIRRKEKYVQKVAQELDQHGTLTGGDISRIYREVEEGEEVIIDIRTPDGKKESFETRTNEQIVDIPKEMIQMKPNREISLAA